MAVVFVAAQVMAAGRLIRLDRRPAAGSALAVPVLVAMPVYFVYRPCKGKTPCSSSGQSEPCRFHIGVGNMLLNLSKDRIVKVY